MSICIILYIYNIGQKKTQTGSEKTEPFFLLPQILAILQWLRHA